MYEPAKNYTEKLGFVCIPTGETPDKKPKKPLIKGWQMLRKTDLKIFKKCSKVIKGVAIQTGENSNIVVVDIDVLKDGSGKKDGYKKWIELTRAYGDPDTLTARTPSSGKHYYFVYNACVKSSLALGGYSIDILSDGKCAVAPPTTTYKWEDEPTSREDIKEMPEWLINFIVENQNQETHTTEDVEVKTEKVQHTEKTPNMFYPLTCETIFKINKILACLDNNYVSSYPEWFKITCAFKNLALGNDETEQKIIRDMWDQWSKKAPKKYDAVNNAKIWEGIKAPRTDINYLVHLYNKKKPDKQMKMFYMTKKYDPLEFLNKEITYVTDGKNKFVSNYFTKSMRDKYTTVITKAPPGTGKSTAMTKICQQLMRRDETIKFLSITSRRSLAYTHEGLFKNVFGCDVDNYLTTDKEYAECDKLVLEIESLSKLDINEWCENKYILFLDEYDSLLRTILLSNTIDNKRIEIYNNFKELIQRADRIYALDADMCGMAVNFIYDLRDEKDKVLFYHNTCKNDSGKNAICFYDEQVFNKKLIDECTTNHPTLSTDSKTTAQEYKQMYKENGINEDGIKLYTAHEGDRNDLKDINSAWNGNRPIFNPAITHGVDYHSAQPETHFLNARGRTLNALQLAQQTGRNRNVDNVKFFINAIHQPLHYKCVEDVKEFYDILLKGYYSVNEYKKDIDAKKNAEYYKELDKLIEVHGIHMANDMRDIEVNDHDETFIKLFLYYTYQNDILFSSTEYHYTQLLKNKGFSVQYNLEYTEPKKEQMEAIKKLKEMTKENQTENDITIGKMILNNVDKDELDVKYHVRYDELKKNLDAFEINDIETFEKHKDVVIDQYKYIEFRTRCLLAYEQEELFKKHQRKQNNEFDIKICQSTINKAININQVETILNIQTYEVVSDKLDEKPDYSAIKGFNWDAIKKNFRYAKDKTLPDTRKELYELLIKMYQTFESHLIVSDSADGQKSKLKRVNGNVKRVYNGKVNKELLKNDFEFVALKNPSYKGYKQHILKMLDINVQPQQKPDKLVELKKITPSLFKLMS